MCVVVVIVVVVVAVSGPVLLLVEKGEVEVDCIGLINHVQELAKCSDPGHVCHGSISNCISCIKVWD